MLIKPLFDYCDVVWGNLNKTLTRRLQKLQNRVTRFITREGNDKSRSIFESTELRLDNLETSRRKHTAIRMYKIENKKAQGYLIELFENSS